MNADWNHSESSPTGTPPEPRPSAEAATPQRADRFVWWAVPIALLPPLVFLLLNLWWFRHCPPDRVYLGYLQGDQPAYTAFARAVFERGNGLTYANPFDVDPNAPRVVTNLGYVLLGWLHKAVGDRSVLAWEIWRLGFGAACYVLFAMLVSRLFHRTGIRWWVFLIGILGAGVAWVPTLRMWTALPDIGWLAAFVRAEKGYDFWSLNLFRQSLYPLELAYHTLFFAAMLCHLERRPVALVVVVFLLWWMHPITALLTTSVVGLALGVDWLAERKRREAYTLLGLLGAVAPWIIYYRIVLPGYPSIQSWLEQTLAFSAIMEMDISYWPRAWGVLLAALPLALVYAPLRRYLWKERAGRLVLFWGLAALAWTHNNYWLPRSIQPMHFARGYIHVFLLIVTAKGIELAFDRVQLGTGLRRGATVLGLVLVPVFAADNALFVGRMATEMPRVGLLTLSYEEFLVVDYFRKQPGSLVIASMNQVLGIVLVAETPHRVCASEEAITPFFRERQEKAMRLLQTGSAALAGEMGVDRVILVKVPGAPYPAWALDPRRFEVLMDTGMYQVGRVLSVGGGGADGANR